jgi:hypothetical protein
MSQILEGGDLIHVALAFEMMVRNESIAAGRGPSWPMSECLGRRRFGAMSGAGR